MSKLSPNKSQPQNVSFNHTSPHPALHFPPERKAEVRANADLEGIL